MKYFYSGKAHYYEVKKKIRNLSTLKFGSDNTENLQVLSPLKQHFFVCAKEMYVEPFNEVLRFLNEGDIDIPKDTLSFMIHSHKAGNPEPELEYRELYASTALNWTNKNNNAMMAFELLKLEEEAHTDKLEAFQCLKENLDNVELLPWIVDTHNHFHPDFSCLAGIEVVFIIIFMYMSLVYDYYSDVSLIFDYENIANANASVIQTLLACNKSSQNFQNSDYSKMNLNETFQTALDTSIGIISFSGVLQIIALILFYPITESCRDFLKLKDTFNRIAEFKEKGYKRLAQISKLIIKTFLKLSGLIVHLWITYSFKSSKNRKDDFLDLKAASDNVLKLITTIQSGIGNSFQLILQIWLLKPFFQEIMDWNAITPILASFNGIANILTFDSQPACYLEKALGKILLTLLSFSLGIAMVRTDKPIKDVRKTPLRTLLTFLSIFSQALARIFALSSLEIMQVESESFKYSLFFALHTIAISIVNILFVIRRKKEEKEFCKICKDSKTPEDCKDCKKQAWKKLANRAAKRFMKILISALSSTIIMVHIPKQKLKGGGKLLSFLSHSSFFVIVLIENMALALLPCLLPHLYPNKFPWRLNIIISILILWIISVILQEI